METAKRGAALRRDAFELPEGVVYLDGNSLGPLPRAVRERVAAVASDEWGAMLVGGWNTAGWFDLPETVGEKIAPLVGAPPGTVMVADSTSVNLFKVLDAALDLAPERAVILSDTANFPTDLYVAQGVAKARPGVRLVTVAPDAVADVLDERVAVLMLTEVDYRTGRRHDVVGLTRAAHEAGAIAVWDLAHSAGAFPVDLLTDGVDFAIGCGYKYLNGGPGAPAFVYVREDHAAGLSPALRGWMGHAAPFEFTQDYRPGPGVTRLRVGTPPILSLAALDSALDLWADVDLEEIRACSTVLSEAFIDGVERTCAPFGVTLASPRDAAARGSQVSFRHAEGYAVVQALIARGVIGDFRAPDLVRFGFAPLYNGLDDVEAAVETLARVLRERLWDRPELKARAKVT